MEFKKIFLQRKVMDDMIWSARARDILARYPEAEIVEVDQHWRIPELAEAEAGDWIQTKKNVLVLGLKSGLDHRVNGRSADYIAASVSNGCLSSCQYCYVARRKGTSNPPTIFVNVDQIADSIEAHQKKLGPKTQPNQTDAKLWTYDIGCNADLSIDAQVCDHPGYLINRFAEMPFAKATFATKTVLNDYWLKFDPKGHTRIRYSIMPPEIAKYVDIRTSPIPKRIEAVNPLVEAGYEVQFSFSPIIMYGGEQWKADWLQTFEMTNDELSEKAKAQMACEAFFLSHSPELHELNLKWNPKGEEYLWQPEIQTQKKTKEDVIVYDYALKRSALAWFESAVQKHMPYCPVRYSF